MLRLNFSPLYVSLTADLERRIQALEDQCFRRILGISYREHQRNEYPCRTSGAFTVNREALQVIMFGDVCRHDTLPKIGGTVDGSRRRGRPRKYIMEGQHQEMDKSVNVIIVANRR